MKNSKIKALSFFTGAMGLDIGLEKAGIDRWVKNKIRNVKKTL